MMEVINPLEAEMVIRHPNPLREADSTNFDVRDIKKVNLRSNTDEWEKTICEFWNDAEQPFLIKMMKWGDGEVEVKSVAEVER